MSIYSPINKTHISLSKALGIPYDPSEFVYSENENIIQIDQKIDPPFKGKKHTDETKQLLRELKLGDKNNFYGRKHSRETIEKIKEKCKKLIPSNKGKKGLYQHSEESKSKISQSMCGRSHSEDTKEKMRLARTKYWKNKKGTT